MVYQWGVIKYKVDAQVAGEEIERIASVRPLTAESVVEESKSETSPLYPIFEWENEKAGHEWRKHQARVMLGNLVTISIDDVAVPVTRAYVNITSEGNDYTSMEVVVKDEGMMDRLIERALNELRSFQSKYTKISCISKHFGKLKEFENAVLGEVGKQ